MTSAEIAERIRDHLHRLEADPAYNLKRGTTAGKTFFGASAYPLTATEISVRYLKYQPRHVLTLEFATKYLAYLDQGGFKTHIKWMKEQQ